MIRDRPAAPESLAIRYRRTADGGDIAYAVHGSGPVLVRVLGWFTHLEMEWEWPALRRIWERLAESHTVVRYDGRGIGLSGPWTTEFTEETRQLDLDAVLGAVGADEVVLFGISEGGWTAARYQESLHRRDDARDVMATIRTPTLVIHCREDRVVPFEEGRLIAAVVPDARFLPLPTGTHYSPVDDTVTDALAAAIARFTRASSEHPGGA